MKLFRRRNEALSRPLETERFVLRPLNRVQTLWLTSAWRKDPEILVAFFQSSKPKSLLRCLPVPLLPNNTDRFAFAIHPKGVARPIGIDVVNLAGYRSAYFTVAVDDRSWRGRGVVTEVRAKLINHLFANGIERIFGIVAARNASSIFNYKRLGFSHVGTWHRHRVDPLTGEIFDMVNFELFRDKWLSGPWAERSDDT